MGKHFSEFALRDRMLQYLFLAICISNLNAEAISDSHIQQIFKDFESELEDELQFKMINGATSNHFSKHNNFSREMVKRNTLFKNVVTYLTKEMNMEHEDAKTQARQALIEKDGSYDNRIGNPLCDAAKAIPSCDTSSAFRTINGKCNNLHNPVWGEVNTPFIREILVGNYDSGSCENIEKGHLKKTYKNWGDVYSIEFDIVVAKKPATIMSVFHFTSTNHNCCNDGDRIPAFWVNSATFVFRASIGSHNHNYGYDGFNFVLGKSYHIAIKQSTDGSKYWFEIIINGNSQLKLENKFARTYSTVNLYTGDPWYEPFSSDFGSVCNLKIKQGVTAVSTRDANECKDSNENTCALYAHWLCKIDDLKKFCLKTCNACPVEIPSNENYEICPKRTNLPSPRTISNRFHEDLDLPSTKNTHMVTQFGQYLDHDIAETPSHEVEDCCTKGKTDECFPIPVPNDDNFYGPRNVTCLEFRRSVIFCGEKGGSKEQFNEVTHFIDASTVYGSEEEIAHELRTFVNGKLKVTQLDLLPVDDNGVEKAGDHRVNEMPGLAVMHTLFVREHNRLAKLIKLKNPYWDDEKIYQNARRIMIAQHQSITYGEFHKAVLGENNLESITLSSEGSIYDSFKSPSITNEFATASYRFGHSMIQGIIELFATDNSGKVDEFILHQQYFNTSRLAWFAGDGMEKILTGLVNQPAQSYDRAVTIQVTNFLFPDEGKTFGGDLVARNIQRARDHGLPGFCCYYKLYDDENFDCTSDWSKRYNSFSPEDWALLQSIYEKPSDIDLFTGGLAQKPLNGGLLGKVFNRMLVNQFERSMTGDRFFFTHKNQKGSFTKAARTTLINRTLAGIICDNTNISAVPRNVFSITPTTEFINCDEAPKLGDISYLLMIGTD